MVSPLKKDPMHLSPLNTSWHNRSMSSISATSDAATFHSAHAHPLSSNSNMELRPLSQLQSQPFILSTKPMPSPKLEAIKMDRQDSGYSDTPTPTSPGGSSYRRSTSSSRSRVPGKPKRRATGSSATSVSRPSTKRASRSSAHVRTSTSGSRPSMQSRHTTTTSYSHNSQNPQPYQFFQFPTFSSPAAAEDAALAQTPPPPPPPATVQYWTSDSTRRLEYAAIDAASKGVRGFFIKLVPDCILPKSSRRTKFCDGDEGSDAGSVRRYRLQLPEEKVCPLASSREMGSGSRAKVGLMRRLSSFGRGSRV